MTKDTGLSRLPLPHIVADIFGAGVVFLLSAAFLRLEQRLIEKLVATKDLSEKLIETLPGVFCIFDAEGNVQRWNRNFLGYPAAERFETGIFTTVAQQSLEIAPPLRLSVRKDILRRSQLEFKRKLDRSRNANLIEGVETCIIAACKAVRK